ncbi:beta-lactamase/transpeptidase-like protein [Dactylonectria macrodidyma]|uniref:Beta-lactamase/transpeptidase-like protein n=1 Tax=Dactylonectria macrodidyma TaxID=307937 RepID=A0A9P9DBJ7_9HYPO|nr:beta-lactamase/transpeptidase-like protein [Dactylonectria macrodidyma]
MSSFSQTLLARTAPDGGDLFGAVAAVADQTSRLVFTCSGGRRKWDSSDQPDLDTTYWAYSFTKLLTTIAALQCVERGQISLDDRVEGILPELKNPQIIGPGDSEAGTQFTLTPAIHKITLRHLLTHTSGVGYDVMNSLLLAWRESRGESTMSMCGDVVKAFSMPLLFEPGESWSYGGSLDWAGQLVERLTGQPLGEYMEKNIFSRLEMKNTTFNVIENPHVKRKVMDMATRSIDGKLSPMDHMYPENAKTDSGGMGIVTSVGDFIQVVADLIKEEPLLLQSETRDQMFEPQFEAIGKQADGLMAMGFMHENLTGGEKSPGAFSFGLGGLITLTDTPNLPAGTLSWGGMPNLAWFANKQKGVAACYGCQIMPPGDEASMAVLAEFAKEAWKHSSDN